MVYRAKNHVLHFNDKSMDYMTFGKGKKPLLIIPGLGDGLATVKGMAQMLALADRGFAIAYQVYVFSRINELPENYRTRDTATDIAETMDVLGLKTIAVLGISQGGMLAQWLVGSRFPGKS